MKIALISFVLLLTLIACNENQTTTTNTTADTSKIEPTSTVDKEEPKPVENTLVTDSAWGPITATTDFNALIELYGKNNLRDERICGAECADSVDVTYVFHNTPKQITVYWKEKAWHKKIDFIESYQVNSPYHTANGIKNGSTLEELVKLNGKKITFGGFGWDYGGYIRSYNGGAFEKSRISLRLDLNDENNTTLLGENTFDTDMPSVKKVITKITVWQMTLSFE